MKQGRIQPVYVLSSTKERKRIRKFNKCYTKMYLLSKRHKFILPLQYMVLNIKEKEIRQICAYLDNINY